MCVCAESLAYLTAATHGLSEEAQTIADSLQPSLEKVCTPDQCMYMYIHPGAKVRVIARNYAKLWRDYA